ncbi:MAG: response regulator transcription factor [Chromatiaceae bacterium]|nr:response regulator transcription factor [Chromatiaceae bacterium]MCP5437427.1 response regulator transcription factor [Chromatiaceae bacterium]MCP5440021.1 response regulator transcription factor [Chromatiaceae bacterium]HPE78957.1 response regulator transcription factor [Gammaproteobacteria bacterium]
MRVLLVEDDALLGAAIQAGLEQSDYTVDWLRDGAQAASALRTAEPDLLILDIGLPGRSGLEVLAELRARGSNLPVLLLTARDTVSDRIAGLDRGADDYLVKPFDLGELTARLRAIARRRGGRAEAVIRHGDLVLDPASRAVTRAGESVSLSAKATMILEALLERPGIPVSRERLELTLYGWNEGVDSNTIEVHVHHLRKKLGKDLIRTVRGLGYMIPKQ